MHVINSRNVCHALVDGLHFLSVNGIRRNSRNGAVLVSPVPVTTVYERPGERVLLSPGRDANPFFHLVEGLWMLAGREDIATLTQYVAHMKNFSDDGKTQAGAYGWRWRSAFGQDQLSWAIQRLKADNNDRRVIVQMYNATVDQKAADHGGKDIPCNIVAAPWIDARGNLSMTVFCRSNDIIWGAYGANAVHFSMMQEYLAHGIGVHLGQLYQVSNNYHAYLDVLDRTRTKMRMHAPREAMAAGIYETMVHPYAMFDPEDDLKLFDQDLTIFFDEPCAVGLRSAFLRKVACPMVMAHKAYRNKADPERFDAALEIIQQCRALDWKLAGLEWLERRKKEHLHAKDDGVNHDSA